MDRSLAIRRQPATARRQCARGLLPGAVIRQRYRISVRPRSQASRAANGTMGGSSGSSSSCRRSCASSCCAEISSASRRAPGRLAGWVDAAAVPAGSGGNGTAGLSWAARGIMWQGRGDGKAPAGAGAVRDHSGCVLRTVPLSRCPCSVAPPVCAAGAPIRCASRAGGCRCVAVRPPARRRARRHCGATAPAGPRLRG